MEIRKVSKKWHLSCCKKVEDYSELREKYSSLRNKVESEFYGFPQKIIDGKYHPGVVERRLEEADPFLRPSILRETIQVYETFIKKQSLLIIQ